jgi:hypothetical protein
MKTVGYLGRIDKLFGVPATTRNWNTILAVVRTSFSSVRKVSAVDCGTVLSAGREKK